jgi:epoxyqueuosine reductase
VKAVQPELSVEELTRLSREQGFHKIAFVLSKDLPDSIARHPLIRELGRGSYLLVALSCYRLEDEDASTPGDPHALIAGFARRNYYREAVLRLKRIVRQLGETKSLSKRSVRIFCNSPLPEKPLAVVSGLGGYGRNSLILIPGLGSQFVIAGLFLPVKVTGIGRVPDSDSSFSLCAACQACREACPVNALSEEGRLDESRCLQALCTETVPFSEASRRAWGYRFYGCQSCQDVCPYNGKLSLTTPTELGELGASISLKKLLSFSPRELKSFLQGSALSMSWIPVRALLRNALIAAGNRGEKVLASAVERHLGSEDALLREAASWAAARIGKRS